jgi:hypothetical protein
VLGGLVSHLIAQCGCNVHRKGAVENIASNVVNSCCLPGQAADLWTDSFFLSDNKSAQWICWDIKDLRIEPTHDTIRKCRDALKSWLVDGSNAGDSRTEIDRRESINDSKACLAVLMFTIARSGSFYMIRLPQAGPNSAGTSHVH